MITIDRDNMIDICQVELYLYHKSLSTTEDRTLFVIWCKHLIIGKVKMLKMQGYNSLFYILLLLHLLLASSLQNRRDLPLM